MMLWWMASRLKKVLPTGARPDLRSRRLLGITLAMVCILMSCADPEPPPAQYLFFFHGYWLEQHTGNEKHPQHGRYYYGEQIVNFRSTGLTVISEQRPPGTNAAVYANHIVSAVDSLLKMGIPPRNITVAGASKGGYIAQYVATYLQNPAVKFAFIASYREQDLEQIPEIDWCGQILSIYETSDSLGVPARERYLRAGCQHTSFQEIQLSTGLGHGFIFRPLPAWQEPLIRFAKGQ